MTKNKCKFCENKKVITEQILCSDISKAYKCNIKNPYKGIIDIISENKAMPFEIVVSVKYCPFCGKKQN